MTIPRHSNVRPSLLVGRDRELGILRDHLAATLGGNGSLVLIGGAAGIGKTALAETLCREAAEQGALTLVGQCYDLTETPPLGPWIELFGRYQQSDGGPPLPATFAESGLVGEIASQAALFHQIESFCTMLTARQPLLLLLDDMHWSDTASLDVVRFLSRSLASLPLLLLFIYRTDEVTNRHPLYRLLPTLIREGQPERLEPRQLRDEAVHELITTRYGLPDADTLRLVPYLQGRAEGNPFFLGELIHALEDAAILRPTIDGWALHELSSIGVPLLLRQVIDGRLSRLGEDVRNLLAAASVIGQEISLSIWHRLTSVDEERFLTSIERATEAHLLESAPTGASARFAHALIRQTLYEGILPARRRVMHRQIGEAIMQGVSPDPDVVAYHFQQAGDERAIPWLIQAGERAERAYAWLTAADRFAAAVTLMEESGADVGERGWLRYRMGTHRRYANPGQSIVDLAEARRLAVTAQDRALEANALCNHGLVRCQAGEIRAGLIDQKAGLTALRALTAADRDRLAAQPTWYLTRDETDGQGTFSLWLAIAGHFAEARELGEFVVAGNADPAAPGEVSGSPRGDAYDGLAQTYAAMGLPEASRRAYTHARAAYRAVGHHYRVGLNAVDELRYLLLYRADDLSERRRLVAEAEEVWMRASGTVIELPFAFARVPLLLLEGQGINECPLMAAAPVTLQWIARSVHGPLARLRGDTDLAWADVNEMLPAGPKTEPGDTPFLASLVLHRLAAALAIESGDLATAREWLEAHDRWLAWSGAVLGRADGDLGWAAYHRAAGDTALAYEHASEALKHATEPRQPLILLAAHRLLGELDSAAGRDTDAAIHLDTALALADACAAPFERALTLLALAELHAGTGDQAGMRALLDDVRAICMHLGAKPTLARVDALIAGLTTMENPQPRPLDGLTPREVDVLRLIAKGRNNQEIAAELCMSVRTAERHVSNIYDKLHLRGRAEATAYAFQHHLVKPGT